MPGVGKDLASVKLPTGAARVSAGADSGPVSPCRYKEFCRVAQFRLRPKVSNGVEAGAPNGRRCGHPARGTGVPAEVPGPDRASGHLTAVRKGRTDGIGAGERERALTDKGEVGKGPAGAKKAGAEVVRGRKAGPGEEVAGRPGTTVFE